MTNERRKEISDMLEESMVIDEWEHFHANSAVYVKELLDEVESLEAEVERLREALDEYGEHANDIRHGNVCDLVAMQSWSPGDPVPKCTCGLTEVLVELKKDIVALAKEKP